jgi:nucleotide-binding universal stress UspA family protein
MKNILIPTDFSVVSSEVLPFAVELAQRTKSSITLLHVLHSTLNQVNVNLENEIIEVAQGKLDEIRESIDGLYDGFACYAQVVRGEEDGSIIDYANKNNTDLIIMGTHGADGIARVFGSNTYSVLSQANCPVLAIPQGCAFEQVKRILFATDYHEIEEPSSLDVLLDLVNAFKAEVHLLHVDDDIEAVGVTKAASAINLHYYLENAKHEFSLSSNPDIKQGIEDYYESENMDLLAIMPQEHSLMEQILDGSTTKKLVLDAKMPILALKEI